MGKPFTPEQRQAQSDRMKLAWERRRAKKQGYQESPIVGVSPTSTRDQVEAALAEPSAIRETITVSIAPSGDPWRDLTFDDALQKLIKLEKELLHARAIMTERSAYLPKVWTCWTVLNRKKHSNLPGMTSTYAKCFKSIPDGKWVFKDDCVINPETKLIDPVVCCSSDCFMLYQVYRSRARGKEREAV